ncbi:MAG: guanylate kinase [Miltoncostaeaceae bacterium]|nr:guanylate kinase [Miltoncostaeaceae bacterium]
MIDAVLPRFPNLEVAVSATTRPRRPGERDGVDYHFLDRRAFEDRVAADDLLEYVVYAGHLYGTLRSEIETRLAAGVSVVVEIELNGARAIRRLLPDAVSIFIAAPSTAELARRLHSRATDTEDEIALRLAASRVELEAVGEFDHLVVNDDRERAAEELAGLVRELTGCPGTAERS